MKIKYHFVIIILILFLTAWVKELLNNLNVNRENQEAVESLWILFSTGYVLFVMYKLYIKYPKKFNPDYEKQKAYNKKVYIKNLSDNSKSSSANSESSSKSIGESNQPKLEKFCPNCVGKGFVDDNDIKRLGKERTWTSSKCGFCKGTGYVERSDNRYPTLGTRASSEW